MIELLSSAGGKVFAGPFTAPFSHNQHLKKFYQNVVTREQKNTGVKITNNMGKCVLMKDPEGSVICLMQLEEHAQMFFNAGKFMVPLDSERANDHLNVMHKGELYIKKPH